MTDHLDQSTLRLLQAALSTREASQDEICILRIDQLSSPKGGSGAPVRRYRVFYQFSHNQARMQSRTLVLKKTSSTERRVLELLGRQVPPHVPAITCLAPLDQQDVWICMSDAGATSRSEIVSEVDDTLRSHEARALATIHFANLGRQSLRSWLPFTDHRYFYETTHSSVFRSAWDACLANHEFVTAFEEYIPKVEQVLVRIVDDLLVLARDPRTHTLIHADIHPGNVLVKGQSVVFIDWASARFGSYILDVPHYFKTLETARTYCHCLATLGHKVRSDEFEHNYRIASRYVGVRHIWWVLRKWLVDRSVEPVLRKCLYTICD